MIEKAIMDVTGAKIKSLAVALLAGAAAAAGLFATGDGRSAEAVSVRGDRHEMAASGVYRCNALRVVAEGVG